MNNLPSIIFSQKPSRLGRQAGVTPCPDRNLDDKGFVSLIKEVANKARDAKSLEKAFSIVNSLDSHIPESISIQALAPWEKAGVEVFCDLNEISDNKNTLFTGTLALAMSGKVVFSVPGYDLSNFGSQVEVVRHVAWTSSHISKYKEKVRKSLYEWNNDPTICREWLINKSHDFVINVLEEIQQAMLRTAPLMLYRGYNFFTNFRAHNNLPGKTLSLFHPNNILHGLHAIDSSMWSDDVVVLVVTLMLLIRSGGYFRIEERNNTQLSLAQIIQFFEEKEKIYGIDAKDQKIETKPSEMSSRLSISSMLQRASEIRSKREIFLKSNQLYREIHGVLINKTERLLRSSHDSVFEKKFVNLISELFPLKGYTFAEIKKNLLHHHEWLQTPHREFKTGLESLIYESLRLISTFINSDFVMSRGMRTVKDFVEALKQKNFEKVVAWDIPHYYCCVIPSASAFKYFQKNKDSLADGAWAMAARMQYNSWHMMPGNLPLTPEVKNRDYFAPPNISDITTFSDFHHRGHVYNHIRHTIRSPQPVEICGIKFNGFVDVRLLRCDGDKFLESEMLVTQYVANLLAYSTELFASAFQVDERSPHSGEISAFDAKWHRDWIYERFNLLKKEQMC